MEAIEETKQDSKDEEEAFRILIWIICDSSRDKKLSDDVDSHTVSMFMCVRYNANLRIRSIKMKIQKAGVTTAKPFLHTFQQWNALNQDAIASHCVPVPPLSFLAGWVNQPQSRWE
eukprot:490469_1